MKCNEEPNEQSAFEETLMVINAIIAKVLEESNDVFEEKHRNKSNTYNVEEKIQTISIENIILPAQEETSDVKSMIAESNFIAKASFPVKSKNVELETESVPVAENQLNLKNINLFVDKVIDHNASEIIDTENRVLGSNMISSDNQIVVNEIEIQKNFNTAELNEVSVFEKLMEQELNVRINILKSIDAFIAAHSNKTREIVVNAEIKNKVVLSQTREVVDESETYIQSAFIETFDPHKVQVSQIEDIEKKNNSLDDKRDKGIDR
jgi:hypothetical protein